MLTEFLRSLITDGRVRVAAPANLSLGPWDETAALLRQVEREQRGALPGPPPRFEEAAATWAAASVWTAASLVVHRDAVTTAIDSFVNEQAPDRADAAAHYAVDLTMRFLPDLITLAKSASIDDPLVARLKAWAVEWPLSSVGVESVGEVDATPLRDSPTLLRLYADRVIAAGDRSRLGDEAIDEAIRAALGDEPELCPTLAKELCTNRADGASP